MNDFQKTLVRTYADGEFADLADYADPAAAQASARHLGDPLLAFLIAELSEHEGCDSMDEALKRIRTSIGQLEQVEEALVKQEMAAPGRNSYEP